MRRIAGKNTKGFTLIELLVAMLVLSIGLMAMLDGLANYMRINMENHMRNEAMRIAEASLETLRNATFDQVKNHEVVIASPEQRRIRNFTINYTVVWTQSRISDSSYAIQVSVTWNHRNIAHQHDAASIISTDV